jgi:hypothetical protein
VGGGLGWEVARLGLDGVGEGGGGFGSPLRDMKNINGNKTYLLCL